MTLEYLQWMGVWKTIGVLIYCHYVNNNITVSQKYKYMHIIAEFTS